MFCAALIRPEAPGDAAAVDALVLAAFGPGRRAKAAERLREGRRPEGGLSFVALDGDEIVGTVRLWRIAIGDAPALLLGPIAVAAARRDAGLGGALVEQACAAARARGEQTLLLVGDEPYFGRFGFRRAEGVVMPGPVDRGRVLIHRLDGAAADLAGPVTPRAPFDAPELGDRP
ncbi:MAG: N-acetyltransferase [Caulobacteraceae bacterium]|nr:N-acetyltransferase [Caulobacteraceae bacterium]